ncbi:MAG: cache domain-containing protein, partial [Anaerolineae bacterium]|nr:cache domain-containing protein [Anaerolineae bacterium]
MLKKLISFWRGELTKKVPLRTMLIVPFVVQIFAMLGLVGYISFLNGQQAVNDLATKLSDAVTARIELRVQNYMELPHVFHQINTAAADNGNLDLADYDRLSRYFWQQVTGSEAVSSIYYGNAQGDFIGIQQRPSGEIVAWLKDQALHPDRKTYLLDEQGNRLEEIANQEYDPTARPWYQAVAEAGRPTWSNIYRFASQDFDVLGITPAVPIYDGSGGLQGVLAIDLPLQQISDFLRELEISTNGEAFIIERNGEIVASSVAEPPFVTADDGDVRLEAVNSTDPLIQASAQHLQRSFGSFELIGDGWQSTFELGNERHFVQVNGLQDGRGLDWLIVVVIPEGDFMGSINANTRLTVIISMVAVALATLIGLTTYRWLVQPILGLNNAAKAIAAGKWGERVAIDRGDELGELAQSFNS